MLGVSWGQGVSDPCVNVLMATHNGERFVAEQIDSVLEQTYPHFRLLVSDDCSSDSTLYIVRRFACLDSRVCLASCHRRFGSVSANFLWLLHHSRSDYALLCDQDDVWLPNKIDQTLRRMRELEELHGKDTPLLVFTDMQVVDAGLVPIASSFERYARIDATRTSFVQVLAQSVGSGNTMMANRALVELLAQTPEDQNMIMYDWWLSIVAAAFGALAHVPQKTLLYRQHDANVNGASRFSTFGWAFRFDDMRQSFSRTVLQAQSFESIYGEQLEECKRELLRRFAAIEEQFFPARIASLCATGAWKSGTRKVGQIVGAASWKT